MWLVRRKYAAFVDPSLGVVVHILEVGLEHETLTLTKAAYIDQRPVPFWKLMGIIWCVRLVHYIDVGLCATQGSKIAANGSNLDLTRNHRCDHKGSVHDLSEAKLLHEVILGTEHGGRRRAAIQHLIDPIGRRPTKGELDPVGRQEPFQCLNLRVLTAGLVTNMNGDVWQAPQAHGWSNRRVRRFRKA
jgi:hypothetical protein